MKFSVCNSCIVIGDFIIGKVEALIILITTSPIKPTIMQTQIVAGIKMMGFKIHSRVSMGYSSLVLLSTYCGWINHSDGGDWVMVNQPF